jgi:hypothetical protein
MKRKHIQPPHPLPGHSRIEWRRVLLEFGQIPNEAERWRLAAIAESQGRRKRGQLGAEDLDGLKRDRQRLGLAALPDY